MRERRRTGEIVLSRLDGRVRSCDSAEVRKDIAKNAGLAAVILLAPGGFVLGAALAADYLRKRRAHPDAAPEPENVSPPSEP